MSKKLFNQFGPWALVTGASSGIGKAFAEQLAAEGFHLILIARRGAILKQLSQQFSKKYNIKAVYKSIDLSQPDFMNGIKQVAADKDLGLLISNAGVGTMGAFETIAVEEFERNLFVNTTVHLKLAHWYSKLRIGKNKKGGILLVSSTTAFQGVGYATNYAASKAFVLTLGEGLNFELKQKEIAVTALLPGPTDTPMLSSNPDIDMKGNMPMAPQSPAAVASEGLRAIAKNKPVHVSGLPNRISSTIMPRNLAVKFWGNMMKKMLSKSKIIT